MDKKLHATCMGDSVVAVVDDVGAAVVAFDFVVSTSTSPTTSLVVDDEWEIEQ
jgi:hypothetical protein